MAGYGAPSYLQAFIGGFVLILLCYIHHELTVGATRRNFIREHGCKPPVKYPHVDPILGLDIFRINTKAVRSNTLLQTFRKRYATYGNTYSFVLVGTKAVTTIEPENVKTLLSLKFKDFGLGKVRKAAFMPLLGRGVFTLDGSGWQHSRDMLRPNFTRSQVGDVEAFEPHVRQLIQAIPRDCSTVDLSELFFRLTLDTATEFLFNESTDCLVPGSDKSHAARFADAFNYSQHATGQQTRLGFLASMFPGRRFKEDVKFVHNFVDSYVSKALEYRRTHDVEKANIKADERYVFLHELAKQTDDPVQIRSELLNILLAGRDTTAGLLTNVWFMLAKRPDVWARLQAEVDELGGEKPSFTQLKDMKFLRYTLNESLRLHPVVPTNQRTAVVDTCIPLGGGPDGKSPIFIPKNTMVSYSTYTIHRRKDLYGEDADEFKPERWEKLRPGWEYLPFNGGPRICLGQQYALTEAGYTTVRMMQAFKSVESRDSGPWVEGLTLTCTNKNGAKVALTPA